MGVPSQERLLNALRKKGIKITGLNLPRHIAISISGNKEWAARNKVGYKEVLVKGLFKVFDIVKMQTRLNIPIVTLYLFSSRFADSENFFVQAESLAQLFEELVKSPVIFDNNVKVSVFGKWYDLPSKVVEGIKTIVEETRDYDSYFLNLCINYDGQQEIVDSCRVLARKIKAEKIDPDAITKEQVKENIYSSYFLPPDLMVVTGEKKYLGGFLLWDSANAILSFSNKLWPDYTTTDLLRAIEYYQRWR